MTCGAQTRAGSPCKQKDLYENGRCKFHGGLATGPTTEAGKAQSRINGMKGGRPRKLCTPVVDMAPREMLHPDETEVGQVVPPVATKKPKPMDAAEMLKDVNVLAVSVHRCADCRNLSAAWICQAAVRGEIAGGTDYRPNLATKHQCQAFAHWKT